jgi:hypothetical protein
MLQGWGTLGKPAIYQFCDAIFLEIGAPLLTCAPVCHAMF